MRQCERVGALVCVYLRTLCVCMCACVGLLSGLLYR